MARGKLFSKNIMSKTYNYPYRVQRRIYYDYKAGAKSRNHKFELTFERFCTFWKVPCAYCGCSIPTIGIDRIDNSQGYTEDNILSCCTRCNRMKSTMTLDEFVEQCRRIVEFFRDVRLKY